MYALAILPQHKQKGLCIGIRVDVTEKAPLSVTGRRSLHTLNASSRGSNKAELQIAESHKYRSNITQDEEKQ